MSYVIPKETFILVGDELKSNPDRPVYLDTIEVPMGKFADLRVRVALVRTEEHGLYEDFKIGGSEDVYNLMETIDTEPQETIHLIILDAKNIVLGVQEIARGGLTQAVIEPKLFYQAPIIADAASIIIVHNHPSGDPEPGEADISLTNQLYKTSEMLGFRLLDHVIIGSDEDYVSLADRGLI
ncbi:MAG: JAB domain-containing protein [Planctomycetota bacterium]|jgi:DNA repair protein RadC